MSKVQSIENIINSIYAIKANIKTLDHNSFAGQTFGSEGEYTYKSLLGDLSVLLTDKSFNILVSGLINLAGVTR